MAWDSGGQGSWGSNWQGSATQPVANATDTTADRPKPVWPPVPTAQMVGGGQAAPKRPMMAPKGVPLNLVGPVSQELSWPKSEAARFRMSSSYVPRPSQCVAFPDRGGLVDELELKPREDGVVNSPTPPRSKASTPRPPAQQSHAGSPESGAPSEGNAGALSASLPPGLLSRATANAAANTHLPSKAGMPTSPAPALPRPVSAMASLPMRQASGSAAPAMALAQPYPGMVKSIGAPADSSSASAQKALPKPALATTAGGLPSMSAFFQTVPGAASPGASAAALGMPQLGGAMQLAGGYPLMQAAGMWPPSMPHSGPAAAAAAAAWAMTFGQGALAAQLPGAVGWPAPAPAPAQTRPGRAEGGGACPPTTPPPPLPEAPAGRAAGAAGRGPGRPAARGQASRARADLAGGAAPAPGGGPRAAAGAGAQAPAAAARPPAPGPAAHGIGDRVQYWSASKAKWITTQVVARYDRDGVATVYDLNCKKGATADLVRAAPAKAADGRPAGKVPKAAPGETAAQKSRLAGQVIDVEEEDEVAWAALEDAEKAVARALQAKLKQAPAQPGAAAAEGGGKRPRAAGAGYGGSAPTAAGAAGRATGSRAPGGSKKAAEGNASSAPGAKSGQGGSRAPGLRLRHNWKHEVGDSVEYWSKKQRKWLSAIVKTIRTGANGTFTTYDLDCKHGVAAWRVRKHRNPQNAVRPLAESAQTKGASEEVFKLGEQIRYWSASAGRWVKAHVREVHRGDGGKVTSYSLDIKPQVSAAKVRPLSTPATAPAPVEEPAAAPAKRPPRKRSRAEAASYAVGDRVRYWSRRAERWLEGAVEARREPSGRLPAIYDLKCRKLLVKGVTAALMRPAQAAGAAGASSAGAKEKKASAGIKKESASAKVYAVGDKLRYWSKKTSTWLTAVVETKHEPTGRSPILYDLRCKKLFVRGVTSRQLRRPTTATLSKHQANGVKAAGSEPKPVGGMQDSRTEPADGNGVSGQSVTVGADGAQVQPEGAPEKRPIDLDADMGHAEESAVGGQDAPPPPAQVARVLDPEPGDNNPEDGGRDPGRPEPGAPEVGAARSENLQERQAAESPGGSGEPAVPGGGEGQEAQRPPAAAEAQAAVAEGGAVGSGPGQEAYDPEAPSNAG